MRSFLRLVLAACLVLPLADRLHGQQPQKKYPYPVVRDQRGVIPPGPRVAPFNSPALGDGPFDFETYEQRHIRVSVVTKGLSHPWSLAFLPAPSGVEGPGGDMLITERIGRLRLVRNGVLQPEPVAGTPKVVSMGTMAGLMDIALHPRFAENKWIYISYHKPAGTGAGWDGKESPLASNAIMRGTWDGNRLTDVRDIFVADDVDMEASRIAFGLDGVLYMTIGGPGTGPQESLDRPQRGNDYAGKLLRMRDDGSLPPDNPFAGKAGYKPFIFSMGHRNQLGLAVNPFNGEVWAGEQGPNGGDEVNIIKAGKNYGWPILSDGRDYRGPYISESPYRAGMERAHIVWVPSIALSGMAFYTGDRFPNWKRNLFIGGMREGEIARTGQLVRVVFNDNWQEMRREMLLRDLHQRIRDVRQSPDGLLYVLTEEDAAALLRIEPVDQ
ncbi:MAG TPA: PQQ-dependent sugar dehydrogenase [Vicinamibacterales bacterium]|nr:PQQ-dependent sugar dehydrogenase [Vicinamibacterales bacterium]